MPSCLELEAHAHTHTYIHTHACIQCITHHPCPPPLYITHTLHLHTPYTRTCMQVEATKYTELGYIGRDVEDIIKDLVENAHVS